MPLGVVDELLALTGVVLLVLHKVPSSLPGQQLQHREKEGGCEHVRRLKLEQQLGIYTINVKRKTCLITGVICDVMQPSMPFRRHLGCIVATFLCIFYPPMPS